MNILQRPEVIRNSVPPEMVEFGSGKGRSLFATTGIASLRLRIARRRECRLGPEDAVYGWTPINMTQRFTIIKESL
jgi:hypothetical protein